MNCPASAGLFFGRRKVETRVVNKYKEEYDVYIGRGTKWGNPYVIGQHGSRDEVIAKFKKDLWQKMKAGTITYTDLLELKGKRLGCFCKPQPCHGDVLVAALNWMEETHAT